MANLVSTHWLAAQPASENLVILDASSHLPLAGRDAHAEFALGHVPGARFLELARLYDPASPVPSAVPTAEQLATRLAQLNVPPGARIVVYDDSEVRTAARAWFILRLHGHEAAILDGGLGKWRAEGRPLEQGAAAILTAPDAGPDSQPQTGALRSKAAMLANIASGAEQVLDAREASRFSGEAPDFRPGVAPGHIPGSRNLPFEQVLNADGTYKDAASLRALFTAEGIDLDRPVITSCGGGVTAAVLLFALHLAGKNDVAIYDGSWSEWGADPVLPKALGPDELGLEGHAPEALEPGRA